MMTRATIAAMVKTSPPRAAAAVAAVVDTTVTIGNLEEFPQGQIHSVIKLENTPKVPLSMGPQVNGGPIPQDFGSRTRQVPVRGRLNPPL